jgi:sRNA-binding protein
LLINTGNAHYTGTPYGEISLAKPNYSFDKRQREIAKKKQQEEKDARKREAREAAKPAPEKDPL